MDILVGRLIVMAAASAFCAVTTSSTASMADGLLDFNLADTHLCAGTDACGFKHQQAADRDPAGSKDHRNAVRDHRTQTQTRDHRIERKNEVVPITREKLDCGLGTVQLLKMGYVSVVVNECDGPVYHYTAMQDASLFRAAMSAYTGKMTVTFVGLASR